MDPSVAAQIIILVVLILLSALFSSAETALTTVSKLRIKSLVNEGNRRARLVNKLIENPSRMLGTILVGNNIVNLSASALTTSIAMGYGSSVVVSIATGILTLLILIFGEITPKTLATVYAEKLSFAYAPFINFMCIILTPIVFVVNLFSKGILLIFGVKKSTFDTQITEGELMTMVEASEVQGVIESEEREMITNVVDFGDSLTKDVMVPRIDVVFAEDTMTYNELLRAFKSEQFTRLPVYSESKDNIIGIVNLKDIFFDCTDKKNFDIKKYMREPYFTYEFKKTSELLAEMREAHIAMAIVLDEYGVTSGIVTLEDLLEEIVGEIRDEYDSDELDAIRQVSDTEYETDGTTNLGDINDFFGLHIESDDYDSIAGHIINELGHLPEVGDSIKVEVPRSFDEDDGNDDDDKNEEGADKTQYLTFTVKTVEKNRIDLVTITI